MAKLGIASALGAEDRWFKSSRPDHYFVRTIAQVAELVDAPDSKSGALAGVGVRVPPWAPLTTKRIPCSIAPPPLVYDCDFPC